MTVELTSTKQAERHQQPGLAARAFPFFQRDTPQRAEDDDAGHVQRPTGEFVSSHLGLAHGVEEKLHVPGGARESREQIVGKHRGSDFRLLGNGHGDRHFFCRRIGDCFQNVLCVACGNFAANLSIRNIDNPSGCECSG